MREMQVQARMLFFSRSVVSKFLSVVSFVAMSKAAAMPLSVRCEELFVELPSAEKSVSSAFVSREFARQPDESLGGQVTNLVPLTLETLRMGYARGLYPYGQTLGRDTWFTAPDRGVLDFDKMRIGKSYAADIRKLYARVEAGELKVTVNHDFAGVVRSAATQDRKLRNAQTGKLEEGDDVSGTWMTPDYQKAVIAAFKAGEAISVEVWREGQLVGGVYGLLWAGVLHAESMFHTEANVAKLAFEEFILTAKAMGYTWIDVQVAPPDSTSLTVKRGAFTIPRAEFIRRQVQARQQMLQLKRSYEMTTK